MNKHTALLLVLGRHHILVVVGACQQIQRQNLPNSV